MASRLYRITRQLYLAVERALLRLQLLTLGTPTLVALITLALTGLILLDARPTQTHVARFLPARCHDALNRLLREMPWSTRAFSCGPFRTLRILLLRLNLLEGIAAQLHELYEQTPVDCPRYKNDCTYQQQCDTHLMSVLHFDASLPQ